MPRNPFITSMETFNDMGIRNVRSRKLEKYIKVTKI